MDAEVTPADPDAAATHAAERRRRQKSRALIMALLLGAFVVLIYAITIVRIGEQ
jgi:accessory gene regulator protein AgrB